jgi:hypothetical protein
VWALFPVFSNEKSNYLPPPNMTTLEKKGCQPEFLEDTNMQSILVGKSS